MRFLDREGLPYLLWTALFGVGFLVVGLHLFAVLALLLLVLFATFFRNPTRSSQAPDQVVIAPADGKVIAIGPPPDWVVAKGLEQGIAIFMSPLDVHVNRAPVAGNVVEAFWRKGKKWPAFRPKASELNEHSFVLIRSPYGLVGFRQIAGALARRVVCDVSPGKNLLRGERVGIIKFSSRLELYLPAGVRILTRVGDKTKAGETPVAEFPGEGTP